MVIPASDREQGALGGEHHAGRAVDRTDRADFLAGGRLMQNDRVECAYGDRLRIRRERDAGRIRLRVNLDDLLAGVHLVDADIEVPLLLVELRFGDGEHFVVRREGEAGGHAESEIADTTTRGGLGLYLADLLA